MKSWVIKFNESPKLSRRKCDILLWYDLNFLALPFPHVFLYTWLEITLLTLLFPTFWRPTKSLGGAPPMENNKGVLLGLYSQKTFFKGTNLRLVWTQIRSNYKKILGFWKNLTKIGQFLKIAQFTTFNIIIGKVWGTLDKVR
jgi:hypothetical protein